MIEKWNKDPEGVKAELKEVAHNEMYALYAHCHGLGEYGPLESWRLLDGRMRCLPSPWSRVSLFHSPRPQCCSSCVCQRPNSHMEWGEMTGFPNDRLDEPLVADPVLDALLYLLLEGQRSNGVQLCH